ncbi:MAG: TonB-dependent receptor [Steroidobacteraceae bacterium]
MGSRGNWPTCQRQGNRTWRRILGKLLLAAAALSTAANGGESDDLSSLSLEELGSLQVTSVSKSPELLREAAAAIFVITQEDIRRSGATSLAEALRLAPNLRITQQGSSDYVASARGFGGVPDNQNFSNKLLLLIDGRSVYSPLFSGIFLDSQDVMLSDVSRIEVISGPGATLWGANAMNGVINVITRPAWLTTGASVAATAGNQELGLQGRYGGKLGEDGAYRVYAKAFERDALSLDDGSSAGDSWYRGQAGFRVDLTRPGGTATLQGDVYDGANERAGPGSQAISGANLLGRWQTQTERSDFHVQGYFDHVQRGMEVNGVRLQINTLDLEAQQSVLLGSNHRVVWGAGSRFSRYHIVNTASLQFQPPRRGLELWNVFAQDTLSLGPQMKLTMGLKLEHNSYSGWEPQPDARLAWQASSSLLLWAAASRAIRAPTPFDTDVVEIFGGVRFLEGDPEFRAENVMAYETGFRASVSPTFSLSGSVFYNRYDDLRSIELSDTPTFLPLRWGNLMEGHTYGMTAWASWQVTERWRLSPGVSVLQKRLQFKPGSSGIVGTRQAGNDPQAHALLTSSLNLGRNQSLDFSARYVSQMPDPSLPAYTELSARYAWRLSDSWELSVRGLNLLHHHHREYPSPDGFRINRGVFAEARWRP